MKTFKQFKSSLSEATKNVVVSKKIDGIKVEIVKDGSKFIAFIDGDKLDSYPSVEKAEKMSLQFLKQYKGN